MNSRDEAYAALAATRPRVQIPADTVEHFITRLRAQGGSCVRVSNEREARARIAELVEEGETNLRIARTPWLERILALPGPALPTRADAPGESTQGLAISAALAAVAETGSLLLYSHGGAPMSLHFLCDRLVVLVRTADVLPNLEDLWTRVRTVFGGEPPRALCLVSGPSSSGDIGMQFATGVHGPIKLHAIIVDS